jgi:hypothetical protein
MQNTNPEFDPESLDHEGAILPAQLWRAADAFYARSGERLLMLAVLTDAVNIFLNGATERRLSTETRNWIRGANTSRHAISFENACDALGIDPDALRERLFELKYRYREAERRRSCLRVKPPAMSRGPVKIAAAGGSRESAGRGRVRSARQ